MLFWTLGGNQVGKAAIAGWRELIAPNLDTIGLWPFDGSLQEILDRFPVAVVETYPGDAYGQIGIPRYPRWSKRLQEGRRRVAGQLLDWIETRQAFAGRELLSFVEQGFSAGGAGEDQFDAMVGLMGMLDVVGGRRADGAPDSPDVRNWEGWIFGQAQDVRTLTEHTRNGL